MKNSWEIEVEEEFEAPEVLPEVEKEEKVEVPPKEEKLTTNTFVEVSIDTPIEKVLEYNTDGKDLLFLDDPEKFLRLDPGVLKQLSIENRQRYYLAKGDFEYQLSQAVLPDLSEIKVSGRVEKASARLRVDGKRPDRDYVWKRPGNIDKMVRDGYRVVQDREVRTNDSTPSGIKKVNSDGFDELVLLEVPKDRKIRLEAEKVARAERLLAGHDNEYEREVSSVTRGATFDPNKDRRSKFSAPLDSKGNPIQR